MPTELEEFRSFLDRQIALGRSDTSPEESLALWRDPQFRSSVAAVRQAFADIARGERGQPLREVIDELRREYNIPEDA